jgi:hypothetical protein
MSPAMSPAMSKMKRVKERTAMTLCGAAALVLAACGGPSASAETPAPTAAQAGEQQPAEKPQESDTTGEAAAEPLAEKRAHCVRAIEHAISLVEARGAEISAEDRALALEDGADACARDATRAELDCVLAAEVLEDMQSCEGGA